MCGDVFRDARMGQDTGYLSAIYRPDLFDLRASADPQLSSRGDDQMKADVTDLKGGPSFRSRTSSRNCQYRTLEARFELLTQFITRACLRVGAHKERSRTVARADRDAEDRVSSTAAFAAQSADIELRQTGVS